MKVCAHKEFKSSAICGRPSGNQQMQWCPLHPFADTVEAATAPSLPVGEGGECKWCAKGDLPKFLGEDGVNVAISGEAGILSPCLG